MNTSVQVPATHYDFLDYESPERYASYWCQLHTILSLRPKTVLEAGVGPGTTKFALNRAKVDVTTADFDPELCPDYVADVRDLPFPENTFDVAAAFQILEHLPFSDFGVALQELRRVCARYVCISLPDAGRYMRFDLRLAGRMHFSRILDISWFYRIPPVFNGEHYWEINQKGFEIGLIRQALSDARLKIRKDFRLPQNMHHHFFVLEK